MFASRIATQGAPLTSSLRCASESSSGTLSLLYKIPFPCSDAYKHEDPTPKQWRRFQILPITHESRPGTPK